MITSRAARPQIPDIVIGVDIQNVSEASDVPAEEQLQAWAEAALVGHRETAQVGIRIVDSAESAELNQTYRHKQGPTNVLSFPFELPDLPAAAEVAEDDELPVNLLGDLVICAPVVAEQAHAQAKPLAAHWAHMVVHGVLHLLGYDHMDATQASKMETMERDVLSGLGFPDPYEDS